MNLNDSKKNIHLDSFSSSFLFDLWHDTWYYCSFTWALAFIWWLINYDLQLGCCLIWNRCNLTPDKIIKFSKYHFTIGFIKGQHWQIHNWIWKECQDQRKHCFTLTSVNPMSNFSFTINTKYTLIGLLLNCIPILVYGYTSDI